MFKNKKLIIFDMDGTLIDSVPSLAYAINYMLRELGKSTFSADTIRNWVGNGAQVLVKRALVGSRDYEKFEIDKKLETKALDIFLKFYGKNLNEKTTLYPNVLETLAELKNRGYILTIATNKPHEFVEDMLKHFKLDRYLDSYLGAGVIENKKPHPDMLLKICEDFKLSPKDAVMVGDSSNDIIAANRANMDSIALTYGYNNNSNLKEFNPTIVFDSFADILKVF